MARGVANHPETYQRIENWSRGRDGISSERSLCPACKCKVLGGISNSQPMREPLSIAHGNDGGIQPRDTSGQGLLGTQVRTAGSNVAFFTQAVEEDPGNGAKGTKR